MKLGDIITLRKGNTIEIQDSETYRISGVQNYGKGVIVRREVKGAELTMRQYQVIEPNQLMWCKVDTKNGAFGITHSEHTGTLASPNMALADINLEKADPSFLEALFRVQFFADYITHLSSGTTNRKYLTPPELLKQVVLPDWEPEQQRVFVSKLRQIEECGLAGEITHQQFLISKLKQAILQEAIHGKLTADWRAAHPDAEPARQLIHRIQAEKPHLIAAKKLRPEKSLPKITPAEIPFEIPKSWEWCRLGSICSATIGLVYKPEQVSEIGVPVLRANSIVRSEISLDGLIRVNVTVPDSKMARIGDILVCVRSGSKALIGKCALIKEPGYSFGAFMTLLRSDFNPYLFRFILSEAFRSQIDDQKSTGINQLTQSTLNNILIPFPPLAEQTAIVERVDALMAACRMLEAEIEHARTFSDNLLQAVLKEAFA